MKETFFAAAIATLSLAGSNNARAEDWRPASDYLLIAEDCSTSDNPEHCRMTKKLWESDYNDAIKGVYQGQRNIAYCFSTGCETPEFRKNPVLGCAWRVVIVNSGHLDANKLDGDNLMLYCGPQFLDDRGRIIADAQARTILQKLASQPN